MGNKKEGAVEKGPGQAAVMGAEPEDGSDVRRKVSPADRYEPVIYGVSGEWITLQSIVNAFDKALSRFGVGLEDPDGDGGYVLQEVYDYLQQLSYALEDVWRREPNVRVAKELYNTIFTRTQKVDCELHNELGFSLGWSVDAFAEVAANLLLWCVESAKVDVNELVRDWRMATLKKSPKAAQAAWSKVAKTLGDASKKAVHEPAKVGKGKRSRKSK